MSVDVEVFSCWYGYKAVVHLDCQGKTRKVVVRAATVDGMVNRVRRKTGLEV